jgi:uncharacterized membrane protein
MTAAITTFVISSILFIGFALVVHVEQKNAHRLVGGRLRATLDRGVEKSGSELRRRWRHVMRYVVQLGWYYGIHSLLQAILKVIVTVYSFFEQMFERNRLRTKQLRQELRRHIHKSHLTQMADHKAETTLSPEQKTQLKKEKLEDNH